MLSVCLHLSEKGLGQHARMKHRISQLDGNIDFGEEDSESINAVAITYMISAKERKTLKEVGKPRTLKKLKSGTTLSYLIWMLKKNWANSLWR